ncbi:hypothetical protein MPUL_16810 [Mycolicibacterium pulveris]|uniref:Uncharacterized protein n=1 Tax=Mycolicibacterium pulveris TaxID=36813 RepID=A0A7I7UI29_MYCPV|nr:hypothetical protein MPUL_16810 [Mycolicibacterium pulveris]
MGEFADPRVPTREIRRHPGPDHDGTDAQASPPMLFAPGAPREHYFEGLARLGDTPDEERQAWFVRTADFSTSTRTREGCERVIRCARLLTDQ